MVALWDSEAARNKVFPLDHRPNPCAAPPTGPGARRRQDALRLLGQGRQRLPGNSAPSLIARSFTVEAEIDAPSCYAGRPARGRQLVRRLELLPRPGPARRRCRPIPRSRGTHSGRPRTGAAPRGPRRSASISPATAASMRAARCRSGRRRKVGRRAAFRRRWRRSPAMVKPSTLDGTRACRSPRSTDGPRIGRLDPERVVYQASARRPPG